MRARPTATIGLVALAAGCGSSAPDPSIVPLASWGAAHASAVCAKIFGCCDAGEQSTFGYADEAQCRQTIASEEQSAVGQNVAQGVIIYDPKAARRCLDELAAASCAVLFAGAASQPATPSCNSVTRGALPLGAPCEDLDAICQSSNCTGTCAPPRGCPASCDIGQFCDETTHACAPTKPDGTACYANAECTAASVCRMNVCGAPLADGNACSDDTNCAGGACVVLTLGSSICTARLSAGAACFRDQDCASSACLGTSPSQFCGTPLADGSPCSGNTECSSGHCAVRAAGAMATCGPALCDGL